MKTAAILLRVSTFQQDMESQQQDLLPTVHSWGYTVPEHLIFGQKITGRDNVKKEDRQSIKDLKKACESGEVEAIFINEVSRLSRSPIAGRQYVEDFNEMKIPIFFKDVGMWTLDKDTLKESENSSTIGMFFDMAARELKTFKTRSLRGRRTNASKNKVTGGVLKFGYKAGENGDYEIDETEAAFIVDINTKYASGEYSIRALTNYANASGVETRYNKDSKTGKYTTKGGLKKNTSSIVWAVQTIRDLLTNPIYLGEREFAGVVSKIPQIIDKELHKKVQSIIKRNVTHKIKTKHTHILQRKLICGNCGNFYYGHYKERGNAYICSGTPRTAINCKNTTLNYERAESIIWDFLINQTFFFKKLSTDRKEELLNEQTDKRDELTDLQTRYIRLEKEEGIKVQQLVQYIIDGVLSAEDVSIQRKEIQKQQDFYNKELLRIDAELRTISNRIKIISSKTLTKEALRKMESDRELMREKIAESIDKIMVYKLVDSVALLQIHYVNSVYNIIYKYRVQKDRYYFVEDDVAEFTNLGNTGVDLPKHLQLRIKEFDVSSSNNDTFDGSVFGHYFGVDLIKELEKAGAYRDYERFERIEPA